jgi:hypothetical protein
MILISNNTNTNMAADMIINDYFYYLLLLLFITITITWLHLLVSLQRRSSASISYYFLVLPSITNSS